MFSFSKEVGYEKIRIFYITVSVFLFVFSDSVDMYYLP